MATEITPELRQALEATSGPLELFDGQTNQHYVLIQAEFYERMKNLIDWDEPTEQETKALFQRFGESLGWADPASDNLV